MQLLSVAAGCKGRDFKENERCRLTSVSMVPKTRAQDRENRKAARKETKEKEKKRDAKRQKKKDKKKKGMGAC